MISAVYLINLKGDILIYRAYRDDVSRAAADAFRMQVLSHVPPYQRHHLVSV